MTERFTDHLRRLADPIWEAQFRHPFVQGIGAGTLPIEPFAHWVRQDYLYLIEYSRLFAIGAARAPDLESMGRHAELAQATLHTEMELHRSYAAEFGISPEELEREVKAPTCQAYTDFLIRTAALGSYGELMGALLPCMWGFYEIGHRLAEQGMPADARYAKWVRMYTDPEFAVLVDWCRDATDAAAQGLPAGERERVETAFLVSSRYEYLYWDMAWRQERWQV